MFLIFSHDNVDIRWKKLISRKVNIFISRLRQRRIIVRSVTLNNMCIDLDSLLYSCCQQSMGTLERCVLRSKWVGQKSLNCGTQNKCQSSIWMIFNLRKNLRKVSYPGQRKERIYGNQLQQSIGPKPEIWHITRLDRHQERGKMKTKKVTVGSGSTHGSILPRFRRFLYTSIAYIHNSIWALKREY